tara:strand:- start:3025 stop:4077 length:1053 start_codon:yes stop_codon:yes gene_type:complete
MSTILVTGGAGFIGSHTCLSLLEHNYDVIVIDSFINSSPISIDRVRNIYDSKKLKDKKIELFKGDLRSIEDLEGVFDVFNSQGKPIKAVIHFAGLKSVSESFKNPLIYWDNNLLSTINLLNAMIKNKCFNIVFSSSATVYGDATNNLFDEKYSISPVNPYGFTKATIEKILENIFNSQPSKWRIANLRYFNPIGAHGSGLLGEHSYGIPNNIFPHILKVAAGKINHLNIYGNNWPTHDGTGIRDYIHVLDLADGHILALEKLLVNDPQIMNLNIGTGLSTSVLDLISCFERVNKIKIPYCFKDRRDGDVASLVANNSQAKSHLNWKPKRNLEEMCLDGWRWQRMNPNGYE